MKNDQLKVSEEVEADARRYRHIRSFYQHAIEGGDINFRVLKLALLENADISTPEKLDAAIDQDIKDIEKKAP